MSQGLWISFEGIDGAGKSTHIEALAKTFKNQGREVTMTREPGGTPLAESLRALLLNSSMDALTESLIAFAARRDHLKNVIEPALARGDVVLCDRFSDATFAYQGGGRGVSWSLLKQLEEWVQDKPEAHLEGQVVEEKSLFQPDLTVWFDLDPHIAAERLVQARTPDRFESQNAEFFQKVQAAYAKRRDESPSRFLRIDAAKSKHEVWQQLTRGLVAKGWLSIVVPVVDWSQSQEGASF
jgi:dTMP kinase